MPGEFDLPIQMYDVDEVFAGQITFSYDPLYLIAMEVNGLMPDITLFSDIDLENGIIKISFAGIEPLINDLTIANIHFKVKEKRTINHNSD